MSRQKNRSPLQIPGALSRGNGCKYAHPAPSGCQGCPQTSAAAPDDLTCEQDLYAGHLYLLVHHARAAGSRPETPGVGGAARLPHRGLGHYCASAPPTRRPRRVTCSWSRNSAPGSMPSCPGTALRWTPPERLRWRCAWPERRLARTKRRSPDTPSPPAPCW